jgi:cytochrome c556
LKKTQIFLAITIMFAGSALAHKGVMNSSVKARMDAMSAIAEQMKTLGKMAKGVTPFDSATARLAAAEIAKHAGDTPKLFEPEEDDPKSEAKATIWDNFSDFTIKSNHLEDLAVELSATILTKKDLNSAMKSLGATCQSCHKLYRD